MQIHESLQIFAIVQIRSTGMTNFLRDRIISLDHVNVKQNSKFDFVTKEQQVQILATASKYCLNTTTPLYLKYWGSFEN